MFRDDEKVVDQVVVDKLAAGSECVGRGCLRRKQWRRMRRASGGSGPLCRLLAWRRISTFWVDERR